MKILIVCGGTGGHIFPGLSLYNALKKKQPVANILLVLDEKASSISIVNESFHHIYLPLAALKFKFCLQNIFIVLKLLKGSFQALKILLGFRPDVVVGFGGYASFLLVFFAWIFRSKTVIHEQNVTPGRANRLSVYFVNKIATSFLETKNYFSINSHKAKFTGNPLRPNLARIEKTRAYEFLGLYPNKFTILVMGGSQGAHKINTAFIKAASLIEDKSNFQIVHLCGNEDQSFLKNSYRDLGIEAKVFSFFGPMQYVYSSADIVVSRAGAAAINEIAFFGLPSILIPFPFARGHQVENVHYLCKSRAAILIEEKNLNPQILKDRILELFYSPDLQKLIGKNISMFSNPKAGDSLASLVLEVSEQL